MEDSDAVDSLLSSGLSWPAHLLLPQCRQLFLVFGCVAVALAVTGVLVGVTRTLSRVVLWSLT